MSGKFENRKLGRAGFNVHPLGVGSSFGADAKALEEAFERGVNYFYWGWFRRGGMRDAIRNIGKANRDKIFVTITSLAPTEFMVRRTVESALRRLQTEYIDAVQFYVMKDRPVSQSLYMDAAAKLKAEGKVRHVCATGHHRPNYARFHEEPFMDLFHVRYNAVHRGAESDVFPHLPARDSGRRPGVVAFTVTCWKQLINVNPEKIGNMPVPTAGDCYRFALTNQDVDVAICGPADGAQMRHALDAVEKGPLSAPEMEWMRQVGAALYAK